MTEKITEKEMRDRIKEIDEQRNALSAEKRKYESILADKERKNVLEAHKEFEGKCFISLNYQKNETKEVKAFKILRMMDVPYERYAECVALVDGYESNCWNVKAIKITTLPVWCKNKNKMISSPSDPRMIDMYELVNEEDFMAVYNQFLTDSN